MKRPGRVGDSPIIGAGGYADDALGACSSTGHGESLARFTACYRALALLPSVRDPGDAAAVTLAEMLRRVGGRGGLVMVTPDGRTGHACTTNRMVWASRTGAAGEPAAAAKVQGGFNRENGSGSARL
jgi:beta-aspartyl-peptidase (threonine type)